MSALNKELFFEIFTDTAGSRVAELISELCSVVEPEINGIYKDLSQTIGIVVRCLPKSYNRKSFIRYYKKNHCLTIDISLIVEDYNSMYKIEQRFRLGQVLIEYMDTALTRHPIDGLEKDTFLHQITDIGKKIGWFSDGIDWSADLDK